MCTFRNYQFNMTPNYAYPCARKADTVEEYHGIPIPDPYRYLEDPDSLETQKFVSEQNEISKPFLKGCPEWKIINDKLTKIWNYPKYGCPQKHGRFYYFSLNTGLQNQSVLYQQSSLHAEPQEFFNPNNLSEDGIVALVLKSFSDDGRFMAYGLSESGSDWTKILIRNVETGNDFIEVLYKVKFSEISWTKDNKGFFYGAYPDPNGTITGSETKRNQNQKLYYHRLGEEQENDLLIAEFPEEPSWRIDPIVSHCGKFLILRIVKDCRDNILYYIDLENAGEIRTKMQVHKVINRFESDYEYITNNGTKLLLRTNKHAPNYRVVEVDMMDPTEEMWTTLIPEHEKDVLDWVTCVHEDKLIVCYIQDVKSVLKAFSLSTGEVIRTFPLPIGTVVSMSGERKYSEIFYSFTSFVNPGTIFHYDFKTSNEKPTVFRQTELNLNGFNQSDYKIEQLFYSSKDGTAIPMFIVRKKQDRTQPRPCLLYGYGGFNISLQPSFSVTNLMFMDSFDGILAYPNLRGGGEYGENWHNSGRLLNKQNVFDDFQSAAEYLVNEKLTTKDHLVIQGASNGGLLVAACINQRPELFGAAVAQVGVMDMLRFHKFTIGHAWCSDYGNPDEKTHFDNLLKFSPVHNVKTPKQPSEEYPSTLIITADHDDRVSPLHSLKYVATLHEAVRKSKFQKNPILLRVYTQAGHGAGKPTSKRIEEGTDILTFICKTLKINSNNI